MERVIRAVANWSACCCNSPLFPSLIFRLSASPFALSEPPGLHFGVSGRCRAESTKSRTVYELAREIRQCNLIVLVDNFSRQICRAICEHETPTVASNSSGLTEQSLRTRGTTVAQTRRCRGGKPPTRLHSSLIPYPGTCLRLL